MFVGSKEIVQLYMLVSGIINTGKMYIVVSEEMYSPLELKQILYN